MKVILVKDVPEIGRAGTVKNVAPGYARNFLYPRGFAVEANDGNLRQLEMVRKRAEELAVVERAEATELAAKVEGVEISFTLKAGEHGQLYGSVSAADVAAALTEKGFDIDRRKVLLREHIKRTGVHPVDVRLLGEITAKVRVIVDAEDTDEVKAKKSKREEASADEEPTAEAPEAPEAEEAPAEEPEAETASEQS